MNDRMYIHAFSLPSANAESGFFAYRDERMYDTLYPFQIFPYKQLRTVEFAPITIFCGGNGSGKTTLLNVIAQTLEIKRHTPFSSSALFGEYVSLCKAEHRRIPEHSQIVTSDDVFDYLLNLRCMNDGIDHRRQSLFDEYAERKGTPYRLKSLDDYDEWKAYTDAKLNSKRQFVRSRLCRNPQMQSNGESALQYFEQRITQDALYLLDEPENSLSFENQEKLSQFLLDSARFYGCQFILSTHSPVLLSMQSARIYDLDSVPVQTRPWTQLPNVRHGFDFFERHRAEFL